MASCWSNLNSLILGGKPGDVRFVTMFSNLKSFGLCFNLSRDETMCVLRDCRSIELLRFFNHSTDFHTYLMTSRYKRYEKSTGTRARFQLWHGQHSQEPSNYYEHKFDSLEQLVNYYYDLDFFSRKRFSDFRTKLKHLKEIFRPRSH